MPKEQNTQKTKKIEILIYFFYFNFCVSMYIKFVNDMFNGLYYPYSTTTDRVLRKNNDRQIYLCENIEILKECPIEKTITDMENFVVD